jgi:hypothetical protein
MQIGKLPQPSLGDYREGEYSLSGLNVGSNRGYTKVPRSNLLPIRHKYNSVQSSRMENNRANGDRNLNDGLGKIGDLRKVPRDMGGSAPHREPRSVLL